MIHFVIIFHFISKSICKLSNLDIPEETRKQRRKLVMHFEIILHTQYLYILIYTITASFIIKAQYIFMIIHWYSTCISLLQARNQPVKSQKTREIIGAWQPYNPNSICQKQLGFGSMFNCYTFYITTKNALTREHKTTSMYYSNFLHLLIHINMIW